MRRYQASASIIAALALAAMISAPAHAGGDSGSAGSIGVRLVDVPAEATDDPRARVYIVDHLSPGTVINRRIEVVNTTAVAAHIALYPSAATIADGAFVGTSGHTPNELSTWTSISPRESEVPAGESILATVTISVPSDAAPGEQYGVAWVEASSTPTDTEGVTQVGRVGVRLYISVGPGGQPAGNFTIESMTAKRTSDGKPMILATVHNTGGRALDMSGTLELTEGPGGLRAGPFPVVVGTTLGVGDTESVTIALDEALPAGPWNSKIILRSGLLERSARATITFPASGTALPVDTVQRSPWLYPAIATLVLLLLCGAGVWVHHARRRPRGLLPKPRVRAGAARIGPG